MKLFLAIFLFTFLAQATAEKSLGNEKSLQTKTKVRLGTPRSGIFGIGAGNPFIKVEIQKQEHPIKEEDPDTALNSGMQKAAKLLREFLTTVLQALLSPEGKKIIQIFGLPISDQNSGPGGCSCVADKDKSTIQDFTMMLAKYALNSMFLYAQK